MVSNAIIDMHPDRVNTFRIGYYGDNSFMIVRILKEVPVIEAGSSPYKKSKMYGLETTLAAG